MRILAIILFIGLASKVLGEPSRDVRTLIDTPVSMLDWGLHQMRHKLEREGFYNVHSFYDWDENKIFIDTSKGQYEVLSTDSIEEAQAHCQNIFAELDFSFMIHDGKPWPNSLPFVAYFTPSGWTAPAIENAAKDIGNKIYWRSSLLNFRCERKAFGKNFTITQLN